MKYLAFDIEITRIMPPGSQDWAIFRPLGISCAATLPNDEAARFWYGQEGSAGFAPQMSLEETQELVRYLQDQVESGYQIVTWNGLGFDFDILAEESGMHQVCSSLAVDHIDMMFHIFCLKGYPLGLDKAAKGMGLSGKPPGLTGEMAPRLWAEGRFQEVLDYLRQDVHTILDLAYLVDINRQIRWLSNSGRPQFLALSSGWLRVEEASKLPLPDSSWMTNPWPRSKFTGWLSP